MLAATIASVSSSDVVRSMNDTKGKGGAGGHSSTDIDDRAIACRRFGSVPSDRQGGARNRATRDAHGMARPLLSPTVMNPHRTMNAGWLVAACAAALLLDAPYPARGASPEDCRKFHEECTDAHAAGYRDDVGICNVERLECRQSNDARAPKASHEWQDHETEDPERSYGERSVGP